MHSLSGSSEIESVSQFFHILGSVDQQRGCCEVSDGKYEITLYTSCCNATMKIVMEAMVATPAASPSRPSIRFTVLVRPTIQKIVAGIARYSKYK